MSERITYGNAVSVGTQTTSGFQFDPSVNEVRHEQTVSPEGETVSEVLKEFEETALMGCKAVREFLTYSGENKAYLNRAKAGAVAMGSYSRLRATLANEKQIKLIERKMEEIDGAAVRALPEAV